MAEVLFRAVEADRTRLEKFLPWVPYIQTLADEEKWIQQVTQKWADKSEYNYVIFTKDTAQFVGAVSFIKVRYEHRRGEIGYWLVGNFQGQGLMSEAVDALTAEIFRCGFHRVEIRCSTLNERSAGVPRRLGFVHEGTLRHENFINGAYHDTMIWGKLGS